MNAELRSVKLSHLEANPFRDIDNYPFWRDKLDRLKESMRSTGAWPNIIARATEGGSVQLAFGHHRIQAFRELAEEGFFKPLVELTIMDLSDDAMLKMMADENAEEFGTNFMLGTMNAVSAVVKAFGEGRIKLEAPAGGPYVWAAPGFIRQSSTLLKDIKLPYSPASVSHYLGWSTKHLEDGQQAGLRVLTAMAALELIEMGVCKPQAFQGLTLGEARAVVQQAQVVYKARLRELEAKAEEKEVKQAKVEAKQQAALAVSKAVSALRDGVGVRSIKDDTRKIRDCAEAVASGRGDERPIDLSKAASKTAERLETLSVELEEFLAKSKPLLEFLKKPKNICEKQVVRKLNKSTETLGRATEKVSAAIDSAVERRLEQ